MAEMADEAAVIVANAVFYDALDNLGAWMVIVRGKLRGASNNTSSGRSKATFSKLRPKTT